MGEKIRSFTDLKSWREAHALALDIYSATKSFPKDEIFALTNQMRRCAISVPSNIAEGFSRNSAKDKLQFYAIALGSVTELQSQLMMARDLGYMGKNQFQMIAEKTVGVSKLINGMKKTAQSRA